jgi:hypothetical protein
MNRMVSRTALIAALCLAAGSAGAQVGRNYDLKPMNFDIWCQMTAHLPYDRCAKHTKEDLDTFDEYRTKIEAYEIPYLQQKNRDARIELDILHNDPTDRSSTRAVQAQSQSGTQTPVRPDAIP